MKKMKLCFGFLILLSCFPLASCSQNKPVINKSNSVVSERKIIAEQEYNSISKEARMNVDKKVRKVTITETRNINNSTPVKVSIIQEFLPPDKSKWTVVEMSGNTRTQTEIFYIGDVEYRKENNKNWIKTNHNSDNKSNGMEITAKKDESIKEFSIEEAKIDNQSYRILTSKIMSSQQHVITENKIWTDSEGLIYKEESKVGLGSLTNLLSSSITLNDYSIKDMKIEAPIK